MNRIIQYSTLVGAVAFFLAGCSPTPATIEVRPDKVEMDKVSNHVLLHVTVLDGSGDRISTRGLDIVWFCKDTRIINLSQDGDVTALASGETEAEVSIAGTEVRTKVPVRIKIPSSVHVSHDKIRVWEGQVNTKVWAEVRSEKGAFIEGFLPKWTSENSSIARVEPIVDPTKRQSWAKITGVKSGTTHVRATFRGLTQTTRVAVFSEDEEVNMVGDHISKKKEKDAFRAAARKKKQKPRRIAF